MRIEIAAIHINLNDFFTVLWLVLESSNTYVPFESKAFMFLDKNTREAATIERLLLIVAIIRILSTS
jgi:hypothetical protein